MLAAVSSYVCCLQQPTYTIVHRPPPLENGFFRSPGTTSQSNRPGPAYRPSPAGPSYAARVVHAQRQPNFSIHHGVPNSTTVENGSTRHRNRSTEPGAMSRRETDHRRRKRTIAGGPFSMVGVAHGTSPHTVDFSPWILRRNAFVVSQMTIGARSSVDRAPVS